MGLNSLACLDVEDYPETIAASATSDKPSIDLRAGLVALAVATVGYLPLAGASAQNCSLEDTYSAYCSSANYDVLVCCLVVSLLLNIGVGVFTP